MRRAFPLSEASGSTPRRELFRQKVGMSKFGTTGTWAAVGIVVLLALAIVPAISGATSPAQPSGTAIAATTTSCPATGTQTGGLSSGPSDTQWAYGGQGWSNWSISFHNVTFSYNSTFGWTVVFTVVTNSTTGVTMLSELRTLGITVWANVTTPKFTAAYLYHAYEQDSAFANITNQSAVYVDGAPVPALGILNASVSACSAVNQALSVANATVTRNGYLNVTGMAQASVSFSPSLGLIPLNLSGVEEWNSSSTATTAASWNVSYAYLELNGTSGSGSRAGSLSGSYPVNLTGFKFEARHSFWDRKPRVGVFLVLQGPLDCYDGYILIPRAFDFFGTAVHGYDPFGFGSARISSENLYVSPGPGGLAVTAADQSFGAVNTGINGFAQPYTLVASDAALNSPSATVQGQPMPVSEAKTLNHELATTPTMSPAQPLHGSTLLGSSDDLLAVLVGTVAVVVVGVVATVAWISSSRRRAATGPSAVVPAGAASPETPPTSSRVSDASSQREGPNRPQ